MHALAGFFLKLSIKIYLELYSWKREMVKCGSHPYNVLLKEKTGFTKSMKSV